MNDKGLRTTFAGLFTVALVACGGGGHSGFDQPRAGTVQGAAVKGPVVGASVGVFNFDGDGQPIGDPVATASTDSEGRFTLESTLSGGPHLLIVTGGSYVDESDKFGGRTVNLDEGDELESILPSGATTVAVTPITHALVGKARAQAQRDDVSVLTLIGPMQAQFQAALGFDVLTTLPANPVAPAGTPAQQAYAMLGGGFANAVANAIASTGGDRLDFQAVLTMARDLFDGRMDGSDNGQGLFLDDNPVPNIDFNREIARFRNNNDAVYSGIPPVTIDESVLSQDVVPNLNANRLPSFLPDNFNVAEGGKLVEVTPGVVANDLDPDGDHIVAKISSPPQQAKAFFFTPSGGFGYVHDGSEQTLDTFTYTLSDGTGTTAAINVSLNIQPVDDPPVVQSGQPLIMAANANATIGSANLLVSDPDSDAADVVLTDVSDPSCGDILVDGQSASAFTQAQMEAGAVAFDSTGCSPDTRADRAFQISDATGQGNSAALRILVDGAVNLEPFVAVPEADVWAAINGPTEIRGVKIHDADADPTADPISLTLNVGTGILWLRTDVSGGLGNADVSNNFSSSVQVTAPLDAINLTLAADGGFNYEPDFNFRGTTSVSIQADDGGASGTPGQTTVGNGSFQVAVNHIGLDNIDLGIDGETLSGAVGSGFGAHAAAIGDFNDDGVGDYVIAQPASSKVVVYFGLGFPGRGPSKGGGQVGGGSLEIVAASNADGFGAAVAGGDIDDDGIADLAIGAPSADGDGAVFVVLGSSSLPAGSLNVSSLSGPNGFRVNGSAGDKTGFSVAMGRDVNGDLVDDLVIGSPFADIGGNADAGRASVVFGNVSFPAAIAIQDLNGSDGVRVNCNGVSDLCGWSVAMLDHNNDGQADVAVGAPLADLNGTDSGSVHVVHGSALSAGNADFDVAALNGTNGFRFDGFAAGSLHGYSIADGGDVNADGIDDLLVGAPLTGPRGGAFVVYGAAVVASPVLASGIDGINGIALESQFEAVAALGTRVAGAGDFNDNGVSDYLVADPWAAVDGAPETGIAFLVFGSFGNRQSPQPLDFNDPFSVLPAPGRAAGGRLGEGLAGDIDQDDDGIDDILLGEPGTDSAKFVFGVFDGGSR